MRSAEKGRYWRGPNTNELSTCVFFGICQGESSLCIPGDSSRDFLSPSWRSLSHSKGLAISLEKHFSLLSRWWFQICFYVHPEIWGRLPFWPIFFKGVETTNLFYMITLFKASGFVILLKGFVRKSLTLWTSFRGFRANWYHGSGWYHDNYQDTYPPWN